jgi:hypothetical protein
MTTARQILHNYHPKVDQWSIRSFIKKGRCRILDATAPLTYCFENGIFFKMWKGNPKHYPLVRNSVDEEYIKALEDLSRIKSA